MEARQKLAEQVKEDRRRRETDSQFNRNVRTFYGPDGPIYEPNVAFSS